MRADRLFVYCRLLFCLGLVLVSILSLLFQMGCSRQAVEVTQTPPDEIAVAESGIADASQDDWFSSSVPVRASEELPLREFEYDLAEEMPPPNLVDEPLPDKGRISVRERLIREGGGNIRSEAAVARGLKWLVRHQAENGRWSFDKFHEHGKCNCTGPGQENDILATGFALLPFLGAGETHKNEDRNHLYSRNVERGLRFLVAKQKDQGDFGAGSLAQALATTALCEAYSMTADPALRGPAQRALEWIIRTQQEGGGWTDDPEKKPTLPVAVWQIMALRSGHLAGLRIPNATWLRVNAFLDALGSDDGSTYGISAKPAGYRSNIALASGLLCRMYMGWGPRNAGLQRGVQLLRQALPNPDPNDFLLDYICTQVFFHLAAVNPEAWEQWNPKMRDLLIDKQDDGTNTEHRDQKGSWSPEGDVQAARGGRLLKTAMSLLILETYYRHLPLYRREIGAMKNLEDIGNDADLPLNYNVDRLRELSIPGAQTIPPPAGFGGTGQGGGNDVGFAGGLGGPRLQPGGFGGRSGATREKQLREGGGNSVNEAARPGTKQAAEKTSPPQTWKSNGQRPNFARVYIGDGNALELVSLHVTVTIEGPRARTFVDHIFHNPHGKLLEGTFEYPLPTGASPSYYAMFLGQTRDKLPPRFIHKNGVPALPERELALLPPEQIVKHVNTADWGQLQEARIVNQQKATETYEAIVRGKIDPALLEYAGGNTFRGRVFPIQPKGYNRVLIAYEELLPATQEQVLYRFGLPDCPLQETQFTLHASTVDCKEIVFKPEDARHEEGGSQLVYTKTWKDRGPGGEALFAFTAARPQIQVISGRQGESGPAYVYARVRPDLKVQQDRPFARHAVFLLDTSLSEHPDRFNVNMKLLRKILEADKDLQHFNILAFNVGASWVEPSGWLPNNVAGRERALSRFDGIVLEGATDIGAALDRLARPGFDVQPGTPLDVFLLSDGQITWGEPDVAHLVARFEGRCAYSTRFHCYRTGLGADNLELFEALTRKGGGIFNVFTENDLTAAALAHRQQCLQVDSVRFAGGVPVSETLIAGRKAAVYPGGELIVAGKTSQPGKTTLVVEGKFQGQKFVEEYPIDIDASGELAARGWGEIAVASLLALNDPKLDSLVTAYCQQFGIASRVASFLVLENANDYKRLDLEQERGKTVPGGDIGKFLDETWKGMGKVLSAKEAFLGFVRKVDPRVHLLSGAQGAHVRRLLDLLAESDFDLPEAAIAGALSRRADVPLVYLSARDADRRDVDIYLKEARRRATKGDVDGAVRVLSSVVEEHPARGDALRLVGYRLLDMKQPVQAARLFDRVQRARPFEPHSYLDLARSLEDCGRFGLAAVQYEIVLAGSWDARFHQSLKVVAQEDYARMMRSAVQKKAVKPALADHFGNRLEQMDSRRLQSDLRVTLTWNTDNTDVDLWVIEPSGEKCFYQHRQTANGGMLTEDVTQGFGPERYQIQKAPKGEYVIVAHYYNNNPNLLAGETHAHVVVTKHAGTAQEVVQRFTVILKKNNDQVEVCRVKF
jgi:hypothetical protein